MVEEKENHTVDAILVTPVRMSELVLAKAAFGFFLAILMALVTLLINNALGSEPWALLAALGVSALMVSEISILLAAAAKDINTMITIQKGVGFILFHTSRILCVAGSASVDSQDHSYLLDSGNVL